MPALRLAHQIPDAVKAARADYVLENAGDKAALRAQVEKLWQRLQGREQQISARRVFRIENRDQWSGIRCNQLPLQVGVR